MIAKQYSALALTFLVLTGCQSAPQYKAETRSDGKSESGREQRATRHQLSHGASAEHRQAFIKDYDHNKDGELSKAEFDQARSAHLRTMDTNKDGRIDETEYVQEFVTRMTDEQKEHRTKQLKQAHVRFGVLDKNKDGDLTLPEFAVSGTAMFAGWDLNGDKVINSRDPLPKR